MEKLKELRGRIEAKRKEIKDIFDEAGKDMDFDKIKSIDGDTTAKVDHIKGLNVELDELVDEVKPLEDVEAIKVRTERMDESKGHPGLPVGDGKGQPEPKQKSVGELFAESDACKRKGEKSHLDIGTKTLFETTAGWAPETIRTGRVVEDAQRPIQVIDLLPQTPTTQSAVTYMEETTFTSAAAEASEGAAYGESALELTEASSTVRKVATFLPVSDEQLEDVAQVSAYINNRLTFMIKQRLDSQILVGNGAAPNLRGLLNVVGIQTQAKGADPVPDAIYKAMTKVRVTGRANPSAVILHPNDWQGIRLLQTADGVYIWGSPSDAGPERIWGLQVVQSDAETENTGLVADFTTHTELSTRRGVEVKVSDSHSDYFVKGKQAIRADLRVALVAYRPAAICTVTGI